MVRSSSGTRNRADDGRSGCRRDCHAACRAETDLRVRLAIGARHRWLHDPAAARADRRSPAAGQARGHGSAARRRLAGWPAGGRGGCARRRGSGRKATEAARSGSWSPPSFCLLRASTRASFTCPSCLPTVVHPLRVRRQRVQSLASPSSWAGFGFWLHPPDRYFGPSVAVFICGGAATGITLLLIRDPPDLSHSPALFWWGSGWGPRWTSWRS